MSNSINDFNKLLQKNYKYNLVALPISGLRPCQVLYRNEDKRIKFLKHFYSSNIELSRTSSTQYLDAILYSKRHVLPQEEESDVSIGLREAFSNDLSVNATTKILGEILDGTNLDDNTKNGLELLLKQSNQGGFQFNGLAKELKVSEIELSKYTEGARLHQDGSSFLRKLIDNNEVYIVTSVLISNSFSLSFNQQKEQIANLLANIEDVGEGNISINARQTSDSTLQFEGTQPMAFAFRAAQLQWKKDKYGEPRFIIRPKNNLILKDKTEELANYLFIDFDTEFDF